MGQAHYFAHPWPCGTVVYHSCLTHEEKRLRGIGKIHCYTASKGGDPFGSQSLTSLENILALEGGAEVWSMQCVVWGQGNQLGAVSKFWRVP